MNTLTYISFIVEQYIPGSNKLRIIFKSHTCLCFQQAGPWLSPRSAIMFRRSIYPTCR